MEEKRKDLKSSKQREIINSIVAELHPSFYYLPTVEIAAEIKRYINEPGNISHDEYQLVKGLKRRDIQIFLSMH